MKTKKTEWDCDLCPKKTVIDGNDTPKGWVSIDIANPYLDRDWFNKTICKSCVELIQQASKRTQTVL